MSYFWLLWLLLCCEERERLCSLSFLLLPLLRALWGRQTEIHNHKKLTNLLTWTTALSNSMKLSHAVYGHQRQMGHGGEFWQNVVHWRTEWQTTSVVSLRTPWTVWKAKMIRYWKGNSPGQWVPNTRQSQRKNNTQLWMWLGIEARSDAVKSNIA